EASSGLRRRRTYWGGREAGWQVKNGTRRPDALAGRAGGGSDLQGVGGPVVAADGFALAVDVKEEGGAEQELHQPRRQQQGAAGGGGAGGAPARPPPRAGPPPPHPGPPPPRGRGVSRQRATAETAAQPPTPPRGG